MDSINTERSYTEYEVTEPTTDFAIGFDNYSGEDKDAIHVTLDGVNLDNLNYTVVRKNAQIIEVTPAIESGIVRLQRETYIDQAFHTFTAGALFSPKSMDENFEQIRHSQQEVNDGFTFLAENTLGVVSAAEEATARANAAADTVDDLVVGIVSDDNVITEESVSLREQWAANFDKSSLFGQTGVRFIAGSSGVDHCGWGSYVEFSSGKLCFIYRRAANHAIQNTATIMCKDSYDGGQTWSNDRVILSSTTNDLRPDPLKLMANNRAGTFINRGTTTAGGYFKPLFLKTDDEGVTWTTQEVNAVAPYTFQSTGGLIDYPASVGGHDTLGFIAYGFLSAGGLDAFTTVDNGDTWVQVNEVAVHSGEVTGISEWSGCRLGDTDRWIFVSRSKTSEGWNSKLIIWTTDNPLNWGAWNDSGLGLGGNPPHIVYDDVTDDVVIFAPSRGGRPVTGFPENTLLEARVDATTAYDANGVVGSLTKYNVVAAFPEWFTSYLAPVKVRGKWTTALTAGEYKGASAAQLMLGDFTASTGAVSKLASLMVSNKAEEAVEEVHLIQRTALDFPLTITLAPDTSKYLRLRGNRLEVRGFDKFEVNTGVPVQFDSTVVVGTTSDTIVTTNKPRVAVSIDDSTSSGYLSSTGSGTTRNHSVFLNSNGVVGSITTAGTATSFNTTSDYRVKTVKGVYKDALSKVNGINIYDAIFKSNSAAKPQPMVLAHELQAVCPYAVTGTKDAVDAEGNAILQQVDYSKVVPVLIAAIQELSAQLANI